MAKFYGSVGFAKSKVDDLGVAREVITTRSYYGDVNRNIRRLQATDNLNDDIQFNNEFSIVADPYANENFHAIRYVEYMGIKWKVSAVEVRYPRLILNAGGVYNG